MYRRMATSWLSALSSFRRSLRHTKERGPNHAQLDQLCIQTDDVTEELSGLSNIDSISNYLTHPEQRMAVHCLRTRISNEPSAAFCSDYISETLVYWFTNLAKEVVGKVQINK